MYGKSGFTSGSLCTYHFKFPENAKRTDKLKVVVYDTYRVQLYYAAGLSKLKAAGKKIEKSKKLRFQVQYPQELFLTFESYAEQQSEPSALSVTYQLIEGAEIMLQEAPSMVFAIKDAEISHDELPQYILTIWVIICGLFTGLALLSFMLAIKE